MDGLNNLKPERVIRAFERAGWQVMRQTGSHVVLKKEGNSILLTIPVHKSKPIKKPLLLKQIKMAGLTVEEFLGYYR